MPLLMQGINSFLPTTKPTLEELETCEQIVLTSEAPWDPGEERFGENENTLRYQKEHNLSSYRISRLEILSKPRNLLACSIATDPTDFINRLTILDRGDRVVKDLVTNIKSIQNISSIRAVNSIHQSIYADQPISNHPDPSAKRIHGDRTKDGDRNQAKRVHGDRNQAN